MLRKRSLERKLFGWMATLAVLPALLVIAVSLAIGARSMGWIGTLGPWSQVAESGRALIDAAGRVPADSALTMAIERHRAELSESLVQAGRWSFLGARLAAAAPVLVGIAALLLVIAALLLSRRLSRELARPIGELVDWAGQLGRGEPLPAANGRERGEPAEVGVLRGALRDASVEIEEARRRDLEVERTRAWGEMARRVAHEMKNPLTPLRLVAHRLDAESSTQERFRDIAAVIREETARLDELARSFASLGRPAPGPATLVELDELLASLLNTDVPATIRTDLSASPGTSSVTGHYDELQRAFRNLVRNAVEAIEARANGKGGRAPGETGPGRIEIAVRTTAEGWVEVSIADDGVGIPDGLLQAIFEPDRTFKARGTGLGLAIVRQVTAAHGGSVSARNRQRGAEFTVRLPGQRRGQAATTTRGSA